MRKSGILLPVSGIPSRYGIGAFSREAYEFVDFLREAGQKLWQILPLGPTGYGDSPYQSFSTFAGNPYYIDLEALIQEGLLTRQECDACDFGSHEEYVDYKKIYDSRFPILRRAYERAFREKGYGFRQDYREFVEKNGYWLEDYALFMAVKDARGGESFMNWEEEIRLRRPEAMASCREAYASETEFYKFQQFLFAHQWRRLKAYANEKGIEIIGDIPIYVSMDSADVWANPRLFQLAQDGQPTGVAGCPPDAFSATGQLWGNPLYDWEYHKQTGYAWWMQRIAYCYELYDIVRIDHFRGFDEYWTVPYGDLTAQRGWWVKGPGYDIFDTMKRTLGEKKVIAEDLGFLTPSVLALVEKTGYPGMKVLQFAFDSREDSDYLPHNYPKNCVVYTGTHDNDTTESWYRLLPEGDRQMADEYLDIPSGMYADGGIAGCSTGTEGYSAGTAGYSTGIAWKFIRAAVSSVADTAVIPMQDYLGLGRPARINTPSTLGDNWKWRMKRDACTKELAGRIRDMVKLYGR